MNRASYVVSVMAADRVGIIADVSGVIRRLGGNLGEMSQTVVSGYFTMIFRADFPESVSAPAIRRALAEVDSRDPFEVGVKAAPISDAVAEVPRVAESRRYVLTASGPDQIGLVSEITEYLREKGINVIDLATRTEGGRYIMILLLDLPPEIDLSRLKRGLRIAVEHLGVQVELQHHGIFRATNEI